MEAPPYLRSEGCAWRRRYMCDQSGCPGGDSSFHETVTAAIGLAAFARACHRNDALDAAVRAAELLLEHRLFRVGGHGPAIHPSWTVLRYPPYWRYDILQGLRLLELLGLLGEDRATDALNELQSMRRADGRFSGRSWASGVRPAAIDYGWGPANVMLNDRAAGLLAAWGRALSVATE